MLSKKDRGAVIIAVFDEKSGKVVLVKEPSRPLPHFWKFPGGGIEEEDVDPQHPLDDHLAADAAAKRETKEETGLDVQVLRLGIMPKKTHTMYLYVGLADFEQMARTGDDGEIPQAFSVTEIEALKNFMPNHRPILKMAIEKIRG